jgi:iron complex outermembrane recepter protein
VFDAAYHVTEAFAETVVPLAADKAWAKSLDLNAAVRGTDYSTSGYVTTWKVGATWAPIEDIRFRATRSRDIRAPNLNELFNAGGGSAPGIRNPFRGNQSETILGNSVGNPDLLPEKADTTGVGVVLQPRFLRGFSASVDYWNLDIADAIGSLSVQQIIDQCYTGNQAYCNAVSFYPDGSQRVEFINNQPFNLVTQTARGLDFETSYFVPVKDIVERWAGDLSFRFLGTHYIKNYSSNGINTPTDTAGQNTGNGPPSWRWTATLAYDLEPVRITFTARGISSGTYDNSYIVCSTNCPVSTPDATTISYNKIAGQIFYDTSFAYRFGNAEAFFNVRNLLNSDPVQVAAGAGGFSYASNLANAALYDVYGRVYRAGFRLKL